MPKERFESIAEAMDQYQAKAKGYEAAEELQEGHLRKGSGDYAVYVAIWRSPNDGNVYAGEY